MCAFILGEVGRRKQLGEHLEQVISELAGLATRSVGAENKEAQANSAAVTALGNIADRRALPALRHILTSEEWNQDDLQWNAAMILGNLVSEDFKEKGTGVVAAAQAWLRSHPDD
jgi:hypothetical protein